MPPALFFGAAAALLVIGVVAAVVMVVLDEGERARPRPAVGRPDAHGIAPSTYSSSPSTAVFGAIDQRAADGAPLTTEEIFPARSRSVAGPGGKGRLTLRGQRLDADCAGAIWGAAVGDALRGGGCTQAVRGAYSGGEYGVSVAIFNMAGVDDANRLVAALGQGGGGFVKPLGGFGEGFSMARGLAMGHYVVVGWVRRLDGKGDARDEALLSLLVETSGSTAILTRAARSR